MCPLADVTIDTNVLMHANDTRQPSRLACLALLNTILASDTRLCVDPGFSADQSKNSSLIGQEYLQRLVPGTVGYQFVQDLAQCERIRHVSKRTSPGVNQIICGLVSMARDKTFVRVAYNSDSKVFYSHDRRTFPQTVRETLGRRIAVVITDP